MSAAICLNAKMNKISLSRIEVLERTYRKPELEGTKTRQELIKL